MRKKLSLTWKDMIISLGILSATSLLSWWFNHLGFTDATLITLYILAVLLISFLSSGYLCGAISSLLSVTIFNYLFTVPFFSLKSYGTGYPVTLVVMFLAAFLTSSLTAKVKSQSQQHAQNAHRTKLLLAANRELQLATNEWEILKATAFQVQKLLLRSVLLYPVSDYQLCPAILAPCGETAESLRISCNIDKERVVAQWVLEQNTQAGPSTDHFPDSQFWYLAVRMNESDDVCAIVGIRFSQGETIDDSDRNLLLAMLGECAVMVEKERLNRASEDYMLRIKQEQLRSNLLRSISHDLRTPLTTISGNANMLMSHTVVDQADRDQLYSDIYEDSVWLTDLVENLLSITRIDQEHVELHLQPQDLNDLLEAAIAHMQSRLKNHRIHLEPSPGLLLVNVDCSLFVQLLDNLIENGFKYGGPFSTVTISASLQNQSVMILVSDDGPGVTDGDQEKIFDMFYTTAAHTSADDRRGLGLGLALCKTIVAAHNGTIREYNQKPHGAVFEISLPEMEVTNGESTAHPYC